MDNLEKNEVSLDVKDRKLLSELDFEGRLPYTQLAKRIGLSKQGTEYKLKNLIKKEIVKGIYPIINMSRLGYIYCRLLITFQNTTREKHDEIIAYLTQHKKVFWLLSLQGIYDLLIVVWVQSVTEFTLFIQEFEEKYGEYTKRKTETVATDVIHYQHRYLLSKHKTKEVHIKESVQKVQLDFLDKKIIHALCTDGRLSLIEIARKVHCSAKVVAYRIKQLETKGIIEGYRPIINHTLLGYTYYKLFLSLNKRTNISHIKQYIIQQPCVIYLVEGVGLPADIDVELMIKSNKELFHFIEDVKFRFPGIIGEYQTCMFMDTLKVTYYPF